MIAAAIAFVAMAASGHAQQMFEPLDQIWLDTWLAQLAELAANDVGKGADFAIVAHLNRLNDKVASTEDIEVFRRLPNDDAVVEALLPYASGPFSETRLPATFVLGNVVDNTNVCRVIAYLLINRDMDANGRFNLLLVITEGVAKYAYADTGVWIENMARIESRQAMQRQSISRTGELLDVLQKTLAERSRGRNTLLLRVAPDSYDRCIAALAPADADIVTGTPVKVPADDWTRELIRERLFSDERRLYSASLVEGYETAEEVQRGALVKALLASIIGPDEDPERRYRVNLHLALTFSRLPPRILLPEQLARLEALIQTPEYGDPTFRKSLDNALRQQRAAASAA